MHLGHGLMSRPSLTRGATLIATPRRSATYWDSRVHQRQQSSPQKHKGNTWENNILYMIYTKTLRSWREPFEKPTGQRTQKWWSCSWSNGSKHSTGQSVISATVKDLPNQEAFFPTTGSSLQGLTFHPQKLWCKRTVVSGSMPLGLQTSRVVGDGITWHNHRWNPLSQIWLVVSTHLKNISQNGNLPQVGVKIKNIWNHHLEMSVHGNSTYFLTYRHPT